MSLELKMLIYASVLLLIQLVLQAIAGVYQNGLGYALSPRDDMSNDAGIPVGSNAPITTCWRPFRSLQLLS